MKKGTLWQISVSIRIEAGDEVAELLAQISGHPVVMHHRTGSSQATVSIYCDKRSDWTEAMGRELTRGLRQIRAAGRGTGMGRWTVKEIRREDWAESWKRHFPPLEIGSALLLKPSWSGRRPRPGQAEVILDPGLSFGTGQHPTTRFCLTQLVACRPAGRLTSFLDMGTGSGILAIAAAQLGYQPVHAFDIDPAAVRIARENARRNHVRHLIKISRQDLTQMSDIDPPVFRVICANLESDLLVCQVPRILRRLHSEGILVLAGILTTQFARVQEAYGQAGLKLVAQQRVHEWQSGAFKRD